MASGIERIARRSRAQWQSLIERGERSSLGIARFPLFDWAEAAARDAALLPSNPLTKALHYALQRRAALSVYVSDPDVPNTNHLERALRPILGRKNWLFC